MRKNLQILIKNEDIFAPYDLVAAKNHIDRIALRAQQLDQNFSFATSIRQKDILDLLKYERLFKEKLEEKRRLEKSYGLTNGGVIR